MSEQELNNLIEKYQQTDWGTLLRADFGNYHLKELKPELDFIKNDFIIEQVNKIPPLEFELNEKFLPKNFNKLKYIKCQLSKQKMPNERNIIRNIKKAIFEKLKYEHIDHDKYIKLFKGISELVISN